MLTVELPEETPPPTTLKESDPVVSAREDTAVLWEPEPPPELPDDGGLIRPENWGPEVSTTEELPCGAPEEVEEPEPVAPVAPDPDEEARLIPDVVLPELPVPPLVVEVVPDEAEAWAEVWELWAVEAVVWVTVVLEP